MTTPYFMAAKTIRAVAFHAGDRIAVRRLLPGETLAEGRPYTMRAGAAGLAVVFRYGAVALFALEPVEEAAFLESLQPFVLSPIRHPESDEALLRFDPDEEERVSPDGAFVLRDSSLDKLQIVAHVLAKSAVLAHYERDVSGVLDGIEPLAARLHTGTGRGISGRQILRKIGDVLQIQVSTVGRVGVAEQPEMTWNEPSLERLYARLAEEYELRERDTILERKLSLISRTAETLHELLQNRRVLRVEWYIVILILIEIGLLLYELFLKAAG